MAGPEKPDLESYDYIVVAFSGGKDSLACLLALLEDGAPRDRIELWHHDIDGREGGRVQMDWPVTPAYCEAVAEALDFPLYFSWKVGGFSREMFRENERTAPISFERPDGELVTVGGDRGKETTRRRFPQVSADLSVRWCSAYLKIDVASRAITQQERFKNKRTLFVTGERAEESPGRARYEVFEPHRTHRDGRVKRHVDHYRPVHAMTEVEVWELIERHGIRAHPAYELGWGRVSCLACIFGSADQWASVLELSPEHFWTIAETEEEFGSTIQRKRSVLDSAVAGTAYDTMTPELAELALSTSYEEEILVDNWTLPAGAFGESCGPV